jgi:methyltransferase
MLLRYLRKALFPMHPDLRLAGLLPPLDLPHHLRREDNAVYREGVITEEGHGGSHNKHHKNFDSAPPPKEKKVTWNVDVGLWDSVTGQVDAEAGIQAGMRVTVEMPKEGDTRGEQTR